MSGNSGGGSPSFSRESKDCTTLSIRTHIASPNPAVISKLKIGDILEVVLTPPTGPVQVITSKKDIAGSLLPPDIAQLIQCIVDGHSYKAKVIEINGGNCQVLISHK